MEDKKLEISAKQKGNGKRRLRIFNTGVKSRKKLMKKLKNYRRRKFFNIHKCCQSSVLILNRAQIEICHFSSLCKLPAIPTIVKSSYIPLPSNLITTTILELPKNYCFFQNVQFIKKRRPF